MESDSNLEAISPPNKRQKILTLKKGKEKIEKDESTMVCGICFSEEGKESSIRGHIDSCNHYFCFVCILEWSKVESRCPMCKQRFKTIRRNPKPGVFPKERIVNIPCRNQVWHPLGNQTTELSDPYATVNCTECQTSSDDYLLLLCDLCDSAAHTYCVGLGNTVPEGDWYCHDCTVSRNECCNGEIDTNNEDSVSCNEHSNSESDADCQDSGNSNTTPEAVRNVSISEIVRGSYSWNVNRSTRRTSCSDTLSSRVPDRKVSSKSTKTDSSVRTLSNCRNVQSRIRVLRANWNALRNGSLSFSANLSNSGRLNDKKNNRTVYDKPSKEQPYSTFKENTANDNASGVENTAKDKASGDRLDNKGPSDIDRAWKMLDIAKSVQRARTGAGSSHQVSNHEPGKQYVPIQAKNTSSTVLMSDRKISQPKDLGGIVPENCRYPSVQFGQQKHKCQKERGPSKDKSGTLSIHPSRSYELPLVKQAHIFDQMDLCRNSCESSCVENRPFSEINGSHGGNIWSVSHSESLVKVSNSSYNSTELRASSCSKEELSKESGIYKSQAKLMRKDDDAKYEVQSLVKLNLKLLNRDKRLGVNAFKEVARIATHTILAACGLEHKESSVRSIPDSICRHNDQNKQLHMSNLMPTSCRECFYAFVKDVVTSIIAEETVVI